jgi:hypothetical protein
VIYCPGHSANGVQPADRVLRGHWNPCYRQWIWRAVTHCNVSEHNRHAYVQAQKVKTDTRRASRQPVSPYAQTFLKTFISMHQQERRTIMKEWHPHKKNAQNHMCHQTVPAVLQLYVHSSVRKSASNLIISFNGPQKNVDRLCIALRNNIFSDIKSKFHWNDKLSVQQTIKRIFEEAKVISEWQTGKRNQTNPDGRIERY